MFEEPTLWHSLLHITIKLCGFPMQELSCTRGGEHMTLPEGIMKMFEEQTLLLLRCYEKICTVLILCTLEEGKQGV